MAKTNKAVEFAHREEQRAREEVIHKEQDLAAAKENLAKKVAFTKECGIKHKAACAALQLEHQKLEAFRIRQESEGVEVPGDDKVPGANSSAGLTSQQEQQVLAELGRRFGEQAGSIQQIIGPIAEILVSVLRGANQPAVLPKEKVITMVSALDNEAAAENEDIKARDEQEDGKPNEEAKKVEPDANSSAMDAETEGSAQTKRSLEREMDNLVDDDLFSAQEQEDIEAALELSRQEESNQYS